jgi:pimeloyl-ACP methyl ester carboxylesterase
MSTLNCLAQNNSKTPIDYSKAKNWARLDSKGEKAFDVFFMHPTTYMGMEDGYIVSLENKKVNTRTNGAVKRQASVFEKTCNIFAPRYRQGSIKTLEMSEKKREPYLQIGVDDMRNAFEYYLKHYNKGKPFILAGHSQGSFIIFSFLCQYRSMVDDKKLVALYLIGKTITRQDLKRLKFPLADTPEMTGAIITWNTIGKGGKSPTLEPGALCVNPLSWTSSMENQPASRNIYAKIILKDSSTVEIPHFTSARIDKDGGLVIPAPAIEDKLSMGMGPAVYHGYDYDFFYGNLVQNVATRCKAWQSKQQK